MVCARYSSSHFKRIKYHVAWTDLQFDSELPASGTLARTGELEVSPRISFAVLRISAQSLKISSFVVLRKEEKYLMLFLARH